MLWWVRWLFGLICVRGSAGQITAVQLGSRKGLCAVPTQEIRVLPEEFNRNLTEPFTSTSGASQIEQLAGCQFLSFDPAFDALLGTNRTFYQLGLNSTFNYAFEGPVYLPGQSPRILITLTNLVESILWSVQNSNQHMRLARAVSLHAAVIQYGSHGSISPRQKTSQKHLMNSETKISTKSSSKDAVTPVLAFQSAWPGWFLSVRLNSSGNAQQTQYFLQRLQHNAEIGVLK